MNVADPTTRPWSWLAALLVLLTLGFAIRVEAQVLYGSIVGTVRDSTGGVLPGATVTITQQETKATRETVSDGSGAYRFPNLQAGTYTVVVHMTGFQTFTRTDVSVTLNSVARVEAALGVSQLQETVTVSSERATLQTDRAEVREELRTRELTDLPVTVGRNYQELFATLPGFTPPADAHSVPSNPSRALTFNVNGASNQGNNTRIDGVSSTNVWLPHVVAYVPALESIETVNVVTNNFDAEQGLAGGAAINVQIKSGTNRIRGSAFEYHFNEKMRAKNYFTPAGTNEGKWRDDQFGGTLGGPLKQNKLFYFVSYEGTRQNRQVPRTVSVPTLAVRNGDFNATGTTVYDPFTGNPDGTGRTPFAGNVIPQGRVSDVAKKLMAHMPLPNLPGEMNNYFVQPGFVFNRWTVDSKVNWNATDRLQIFGRYSQLDFYQNAETLFGDQLQGDDATGGGNPGIGWGDTYNFSSGITYTLGNNVVMDGHFGWVRMGSNVEMTDVRENKGLDWLGIPGTNGPDLWDGGTPFFDLDGYADLGTVENFMPYYRNDDQYQTVANLTWLKGKHNIRFGGDLYFTTLNHIQPEIADTNFGARGGWNFNSGPTQLRGGPGGTNFNSFASFLLGLPSQVGRLKLNVAPYTTRSWQYSFYVRDQWQVGPRMTLSFGTRYEYFPIPTRADRGLERYNLQTNLVEIGGLGGVPTDLGDSDAEEPVFAPSRSHVPADGQGRAPRRVRDYQRSVLAGAADADEPPHPDEPGGLVSRLLHVGPARRGRHPDHRGSRSGDGIIPVPGQRHGRDAARRLQARSRRVLERRVREGTDVGARRERPLMSGRARSTSWACASRTGRRLAAATTGRQLVQRFGRTASTLLIAPVGNSHYNALQTRVSRRFRDGFSFNVNYTLSRAIGLGVRRTATTNRSSGSRTCSS